MICSASIPAYADDYIPDVLAKSKYELADFVLPNDTFKFLVAPLQSSNRFEYNHYFPLVVGSKSQFFIDNTIYAKQRPLETSDLNSSYIQTVGDSVRVGYRELLKGSDSFWGLNFQKYFGCYG